MSISNRTSRRRRIAFGLGATGGGLLAAAFMPMGIALAAPTPDPGVFPIDTETTPDAFLDANGEVANPGVTAADLQLNADNPSLAAQLDYDINNNEPFSFGTLDGVSNTTPATFAPTDAAFIPATGAGGYDPFEDAYGVSTNTTSYDYALNALLPASEVSQLNQIAEGDTTGFVAPTTTPTDLGSDPFLDALQATPGLNATTIAADTPAANQADLLLETQNATYAASLDKAVEAAITANGGTLPAGTTGDINGFTDAFTNAGAPASTATLEGGAFDTALPGVSGSIDPTVDSLATTVPVAAPDTDPAVDFLQIFDPSAFTTNASTGVETPDNFLGVLAVDYDNFLNAFGLGAPLDQLVDTFTGGLGSTGTDMFTGLTSTIDPLSFLGL
jgi:hypothetical protein